MKKTWEALLRRLRRFQGGQRGRRDANEHPSVEMLSAYHDDQLSPAKDKEIQEHFVACEECPELMLDLDRFTSPEAVEAARWDISDNWVDAAWRRLRSRLMAEARPARPSLHRLRSPVLAWSLTALLLPCTFGLWLRVNALAGEMRVLEAPQLNPPLKYVEPLPDVRGEALAPCEVSVPADARQFLLILTPASLPPPQADRDYRLEIQTLQGEDVWLKPGLEKSSEGTFVVALTPRFLPAGDYRFLVTGTAGRKEEPFRQEFTLRLSYL